MKNILIFAHECAPYHRKGSTIGAQRPAMFAKYLPETGWRPIVICCDSTKRRKARHSDIPNIVKEAELFFANSDPEKGIVIPVPSLTSDGIIDKIWYSLSKVDHETGTFIKNNKLFNFLRKPITFLKVFTGDYSQSWQPIAQAVAESIIQKVPVSICLAEHGPDASLFLCRSLFKKHGITWVADFRDPVLQPHNTILKKLYEFYLPHLLKSCSATINVTPYWKDLDQKLFNIPAFCIPNGFDVEDFDRADISQKKFTIFYSGSVKEKIQNIDIFFEGFKLFTDTLPEEEKKLVCFFYRGGAKDSIIKKGTHFKIDQYFDIEGYIERNELIKVMQNANLLLLLSAFPETKDSFYSKGFFPGKTFEYFGAGRPILSVPGDKGILDQLIIKSRTGQIKSTPIEVGEYLKLIFHKWKRGAPFTYNPATEIINNYTRKKQTENLAKILNSYYI